tara:strand:+ start:1037 stop:1690 length:654 start_codon:yes stop_codon:yes gene_type:complete
MNNEFTKRILSSIILLPIIFFLIIKGSILFNLLLFLILLLSAYEWRSMSNNKSYQFIGYVFILLSVISVYEIRTNADNNYWTLLIITIICILTDIGGFIFGKILKGPRLTKYSPNKTYAGALGSFITPIISIPILISYKLLSDKNIIEIIIFFILISAISQTGDIIISYFKRISKIKDTGKIIPGHGGLLDRIDGMLFVFPCLYFLFSIGLFKNLIL